MTSNVIELADRKPASVQAKLIQKGLGNPLNPNDVRRRSYEFEDEFAGMYEPGSITTGLEVLPPPFSPRALENLCLQNNTLPVCINAMVTNVHGTGFEIAPKDEKADSDASKSGAKAIAGFFDETFPNESFLTLRKRVGLDIEQTGNGYIEVIRNLEKKIVFLRRLDPKLVRMVRLDDPIMTKAQVTRNGEKFEAEVPVRYRRFAQQLNQQTVVFYKQFGCPRRLNNRTGKWVADGEAMGLEDIASEVLHFTKLADSLTPYGVPAWTAQMPSVIGSRKAEEVNLNYLDDGGVPPMMIMVHGGELAASAVETLRDHFQGGKNRNSIPVIEAISTGGSMDSAGSVKITVERFGSERIDDSMFEKYDDKCEKRIRRAWRLPPLFVGAAEDFSYATAIASYTVAEAQVFAPARLEFDAIINRTIMPELDPSGKYQFRSKPVSVRDVENQLAALGIAVDNRVINREQLAELLNQITDIGVAVDKGEDLVGPPAPQQFDEYGNPIGQGGYNDNAPQDGGNGQNGQNNFGNNSGAGRMRKKATDIAALDAKELADTAFEYYLYGASQGDYLALTMAVGSLSPAQASVFKASFAQQALGSPSAGTVSAEFADSACNVLLGMIKPAA